MGSAVVQITASFIILKLDLKYGFVHLIDDFLIQLKHMKGLELGVKNN
jgi:hypothetical protein